MELHVPDPLPDQEHAAAEAAGWRRSPAFGTYRCPGCGASYPRGEVAEHVIDGTDCREVKAERTWTMREAW